jgi:hydroxyacylglutathione hydrolase
MSERVRPIKCEGVTVLILEGERYLVLVDTGTSSSPREFIIPYMRGLGLDPKEIRLIIHTHGHFDHMGGTAEIKSTSNALAAAHKAEVAWIEDPLRQHKEYFNKYSEFYPATYENLAAFLERTGPGANVDIKLQQGEEFSLGEMNLEVIHTPGHTPGSICLYDEENQLLIAGDSVQGHGTIGFPLICDAKAYINSMRMLSALKVRFLYTAHAYKPFEKSILKGSEARQFISESFNWIEKIGSTILDVLAEKPRDLNQLHSKVAEIFRVEDRYRVLMAVDAFLRMYEEERKAEPFVEQGRACWKRI